MLNSRRKFIQGAALSVGVTAGLGVLASSANVARKNNIHHEFEMARKTKPWTLGFTQPKGNCLHTPTLKKIQGEMPSELVGHFYRNGPAKHERNGWRNSHWIDGDGMVQAFAFTSVRGSEYNVSHHGAFVATDKWLHEESVGRFEYPNYASTNPYINNISHSADWNAANTAVLAVGDDLWALWEGGAPYIMDKNTLSTKGEHRISDGLANAPFSAHPKVDPKTQEIWNFGQSADRIILYRLGAKGALKKFKVLQDMPLGLIHDFSVTEKYLVLGFPPFELDEFRSPFLESYSWKDKRATIFILFDKESMEPVSRYTLPGFFFFHCGNAWEDAEGNVVLNLVRYPNSNILEKEMKNVMWGKEPEGMNMSSHLKIVLNKNGTHQLEDLELTALEFPTLNPNYIGRKNQYQYAVNRVESKFFNRVTKIDMNNGELEHHTYSQGMIAEEHIFIPKIGGDTLEDDGWLIGTVLNYTKNRTEIYIFDAKDLSQGPIATYALPYSIPLGFHGTWLQRK